MIHKSHKFKDNEELLQFITREIQKYIGVKDTTKILYRYNRMTIDELAQEVNMKLLRTVGDVMNKRYVRQSVVFVCIDFYRLKADDCPQGGLEYLDDFDNGNNTSASKRMTYKTTENLEAPEDNTPERLMQIDRFKGRDLEVILLMLEGYRNPEIREILGIPKMTYYTLLKKLHNQYSLEALDLEA